MHPDMRGNINDATPNMYEPPDVFNPSLHPPEGEIDVLSIVELGVPFQSLLGPNYAEGVYRRPTFSNPPSVIPFGKGTLLDTAAGDDYCDGSVDSWCKRAAYESCLLRAHNDGRNGLLLDGLSGWIVMTIPDLLHGQIIVKLETWHSSGENWRTEYFKGIDNESSNNETPNDESNNETPKESVSETPDESNNETPDASVSETPDESVSETPDESVNETPNESENETSNRRTLEHIQSLTVAEEKEEEDNNTVIAKNSSRILRKRKKGPPPLCDNFLFEYAINGVITSIDSTTFKERKQDLARVVETYVLLDDPSFTGSVEKEVEVAIRIVGCERVNTFKFSHIYWT